MVDPRHDADDLDPGWQCGTGIGRWSGAGWSRDTTGYNPHSKIIEGGSWTRVEIASSTFLDHGLYPVASGYHPVLMAY